ncbi:MAG TPA: nuclear transport factor 2 family protein [Longimicrobiales bacterium]|nr:nuclear transport factor 2 family protein [Longimicrobiales bacterium]
MALAAVLALLFGACTSQPAPRPPSSEMAGMGPPLSVERFLQAVNARDLDAMAELFGTAAGPMEGSRAEIELRMDAIARILRHEDYRIGAQRSVPGREAPTTRVGVDLTIGGDRIPNVGFTVVRTKQGRWLVEEIELEAVTSR